MIHGDFDGYDVAGKDFCPPVEIDGEEDMAALRCEMDGRGRLVKLDANGILIELEAEERAVEMAA